MFKQIGKKDLFSKFVSSFVIICFVISSVPMKGYANLTNADKLRTEAAAAGVGMAKELGRIDGGNELNNNAFEVAQRFDFNPQIALDFEVANEEIAVPWHETAQDFINSIQRISPKSTVVKTAVSQPALPEGAIKVGAEQLVGLDANLVDYGLKIKKMQITPFKGKLKAQDLLQEEDFKHMLNISLNGSVGAWVFAGGGTEIKEIADRNAVFFGEAAIRNAVITDTNLAIGVLGEEGKRDDSFSLDVGAIYWSGYAKENKDGSVKKVFTKKADFNTEMQRLKDLGVRVKGGTEDFLEGTNPHQGEKAITLPQNSWTLTALFDNPIDNPFVNDMARITGVSYYAPTDAGVDPFDLPSEFLPKIAKAIAKGEGVKAEDYDKWYEAWMNQVAVFTLGDREANVKKEYETEVHRHTAIFKDVADLQKKFTGLKLILNGDGDAMPRMLASSGIKIKLGEKYYTLIADGRSGTTEAVTSSLVAKNTPGGQSALAYVSNDMTASDYRSPNASLFTPKEMKPFQETDTPEAVYRNKQTAQSVQGNGMVMMTSVNGAESRVFGEELADLLPGIKTTYAGDKAGELTTSTFVVAPDGSIFIVTTQFETEDMFKTRADVKSASPEAAKYMEKTNFKVHPKIKAELAKRLANELEFSSQYPDKVAELLDTQYHDRSKEVKGNLGRIFRSGFLGGFGVIGKATGKVEIVPIDQKAEHGLKTFLKVPENTDIWTQVGMAYLAGANAFVAHPESIFEVAHLWADKIPLIAKMNASSPVGGDKKKQHSGLLGNEETVKKLHKQGVAAVGFTIYEGSETINEQLKELNDLSTWAHKYGLAVVVWSYPRGTIAEQDETALDTSDHAAHLAIIDLADIVKIKPSNEFFMGEQTLDEYKAMFAKVFDQAFDPKPKNDEDKKKHKDDQKNMDWLRYANLEDKDLEKIFAKVHGHAYDKNSKGDKEKGIKSDKDLKKELEKKIRPEVKALLIKEGYDFSSLENRTSIVAYFGALAERFPLIFSGGPAKGDWDVLSEIAAVHLGGAAGSIIGRNFFQRDYGPATELIQSIFAIERASALHQFDSVHELMTYALQTELPKVKAELNLPEKCPDFGKYYGTVSLRSLTNIASLKGTILDPNNEKGVWKEAYKVAVVLKPGIVLTENQVREIAKDDFDKVWAILQKYHREWIIRGQAGQEAQAVAEVKPSKALIIDASLFYAVGAEDVVKGVISLDGSQVIAFYGPGAEALKMLFGSGKNIVSISGNEMQTITTLKDEMNIAPEKIRFVTTVLNEQVKAAGVNQKVVSSLDAVNVLLAINKAIVELDASPEAGNIFKSLIGSLLGKNVMEKESSEAILKMTSDAVEIVKVASVQNVETQAQAQAQEKINEFLAKIGV